MTKRETVLDVLAEISGVARAEVRPGMNLAADLGIDSPRALQLLVELEDRLEIDISDEATAKMNTVDDILDLVGAAH